MQLHMQLHMKFKLSIISFVLFLILLVVGIATSSGLLLKMSYAVGWIVAMILVWESREFWTNRRPKESEVREIRSLVTSLM